MAHKVTVSTQELLSRVKASMLRGLLLATFFSAFINLLLLASALFTMQIFDRVLSSGSVETLYFLTLIAMLAVLAYAALERVRGRILVRLAAWLEDELAEKTMLAALHLTSEGKPGMGQAMRDLHQVRGFVASTTLFPFLDMPWTPVFLATIWILSPTIGIFSTAVAVLLLTFTVLGELLLRKRQADAVQTSLSSQRQIDAGIEHAGSIMALGMHRKVIGLWDSLRRRSSLQQSSLGDWSVFLVTLAKGLRQIVQILVLAIGAILLLQGELTAGGMISASILLGRALAPIDQSIAAWRNLVTARLAWRRLRTVLASVQESPKKMLLPALQGQISVEKLGYRPPDGKTDEFLLAGVTFSLQPGESMGVAGPSGAGKSTLCRLLTGGLKPTIGAVRLDGANLEQWDFDQLGPSLGYLPQDVGFPPATVAETIARFTDGDPSEVFAAAQEASAHEMILQLPKGYATAVGPGGIALSGGQRQRLGLARTLYGRPKLVILDEPASHLDQEGEEALQRAIATLKQRGATVVLVGHRSSLVRQMDKILVLQAGRMIKFGPYKEIIPTITASAQPAA